MFDEAHKLIANDVPKVPTKMLLHDLKSRIENDFPALKTLCDRWHILRQWAEPLESDLWDQIEQDGKYDTRNWLIRDLTVKYPIKLGDRPKYWGELRKLAKQHIEFGVSKDEVLYLRDIIYILSQETARLSYISSDNDGQVYVCAGMGRMNSAIHDYITNYAKNASVIFVSGTMYEPYPDYFKKIVGREKFLNVIESQFLQPTFPDLLCPNDKMTVFADTYRLSGTTAQKLSKIDKIVEQIKEISESEGQVPIYLLSPNKDFYLKLKKKMDGSKNIFQDYYRSKNTIGVESSFRVGIAIGLAEVPLNSYDCLANSYNESQAIRVNDVDAWTWQAWSRIKDPQGKIPSKLYCIGTKIEDATRVVTWGKGRVIKKVDDYHYGVECAEELSKPAIMFPFKKQVHAEQRKASPYIKKIWDAEEDVDELPPGLTVYEIDVPKTSKSTLLNNKRGFGENENCGSKKVQCFGAIYSMPESADQLDLTVDTLNTFFRSNHGHHAEQQKFGNANGKFGYLRQGTKNWTDLVYDMFCGIITPATYPTGKNGSTVQCALDVDNHNGNNPSLPRVNAAIDHIHELGGQPIVVASGSADSYHIHIPILRTPIGASHNFINTVYHELKQSHPDRNFKGDTEAFPKQKKASGKGFGNPLKLPLAVNNKTSKFSQILDPDSKEPVDVIFITKVLELREPEVDAVKVGSHQYLPVTQPARRRSISTEGEYIPNAGKDAFAARIFPTGGFGSNMRQCILGALDKQLVGGEGHSMRLAIVGEAIAAGKSREEIIHMFEGQDDFDESTTAKNVDYLIKKGYRPWKCDR